MFVLYRLPSMHNLYVYFEINSPAYDISMLTYSAVLI